MRRVKAGEELTCDYGYDPNNQVISNNNQVIFIIFIIYDPNNQVILIFFFVISIEIVVFAASASMVSLLVGERTRNFVISFDENKIFSSVLMQR